MLLMCAPTRICSAIIFRIRRRRIDAPHEDAPLDDADVVLVAFTRCATVPLILETRNTLAVFICVRLLRPLFHSGIVAK